MDSFHVYSPTDIIAANLHETAERMGALREQEWAHLCELAEELTQEKSFSALLSSLPDHRLSHGSVRLCQALAARLTAQKPFPIGAFFADGEGAAEASSDASRVIYQKSSYTDEAYLSLSTLLESPQAHYAHSFHASCEAVFNGEYEYCILPVESAAEGELGTFSRLIEQYDLKIAASCEIYAGASARTTRFSLLRRKLLPITDATDATYFFECSLPLGSSPDVAEFLSAAQACGLALYRINTLPQIGAEASASLSTHAAFMTDNADLRAFLLYLAMEAPHYTPIGFYPHLTKKGL